MRSTLKTVLALLAAPLLFLGAPGSAWAQQKATGTMGTGTMKGTTGTAAGAATTSSGASSPLRVKFKSIDVTGGSKPGDTVTVKATFEHSGGSGSRNVAWKIFRDNDQVLAQGTKSVTAGATGTWDQTATWTATAGPHTFYAEVDPNNALNESGSERANNMGPNPPVSRVYSNWPSWGEAMLTASRQAISSWIGSAGIAGIVVTGPVASGGAIASPVDVKTSIRNALTGAGMASSAADGIASVIAERWIAWGAGFRIPGLPFYPSFAAVPAPIAPPTANATFKVAAGTSAGGDALKAGNLASAIKSRIGSAASEPGAGTAIDQFASNFESRFNAWRNSCDMRNIMGGGPVPTFAPPLTPVGPVVGGAAVGGPGFLSNQNF